MWIVVLFSASVLCAGSALAGTRAKAATADRAHGRVTTFDTAGAPTALTTIGATVAASTNDTRRPRNSGGHKGKPMRITMDGVNVREWPSTRAPVFIQLHHDEIVYVLESRGDWRRIAVPGNPGESWVAAFLLDAAAAGSQPEPGPPAGSRAEPAPPRAKPSPSIGQGGG